jgi:hypothetical protein
MKSPNFRTLVFIAVSVIVAACASSIVSKENYSGFLKDYSQLKEVKAPDGVMVMRYVSPKLTSGQYHAIMMDPVVFYPSPRANENVTTPVLDQIRNYMDATYREKIGARVTMVDQPGPGVARLRVGLTAAKAQNAPLEAYQYIPVALVITATSEAAWTRDKLAELYGEAELVDSQTGEVLGQVVRKVQGTSMKGGATAKIKLEDLKAALDRNAEGGAEFLAQYMHAR